MMFHVGDKVKLKCGKIRTADALRYMKNDSYTIKEMRRQDTPDRHVIVKLPKCDFGVFNEDIILDIPRRTITEILNDKT